MRIPLSFDGVESMKSVPKRLIFLSLGKLRVYPMGSDNYEDRRESGGS